MEPEESGNNPMAGSSEPTTQPSNSSKSSANPLSEKSVINSSKPEFVASFLSLDISFVTNLPSAVFEKISARANEFEALKSQRLLDEVSYGKFD